MVSMTFARIAALLSGLACLATVFAAPIQEPRDLTVRTTQAAPHWVIYTDKWVSGETGPPAPADIDGYNTLMLSFLLSSGAADQALTWANLADADRKTLKTSYESAGIKLLVSAFGATETPTTSGVDAVTAANSMADFVKKYELDGIDVDYEDFDAINKGDGKAEQWLIDFTTQLRSQLPASDYIITHAPVAPWFRNDGHYTGGGYIKVDKEAGSSIDWYNIQFYNQGTDEYTTCDNLLNTSSSTWPDSALFQIAASGVDLNKLVIGKPAQGDANNGFMDPALLATCVSQAKAKGWNAGVMVWEFPDAASAWIKTVRGTAFP
ncbi:glycoside hydrolase [Gloeophyllum trabeum ATCC 11539]|uniref:chitinase n=1 Tax=Gloeophyllum trabeum (strain ATCC 11539 / FP-39264 / Madison 617) TaxID=670483 RepID=S7QCT2_GLOTA|nr:glycoside hydrolase [Gloeophyllum trabeum ATCC 11539]EPQ57162.1 glycoside hydrolase [Gloeophyllum trabeum ATCC 11539]